MAKAKKSKDIEKLIHQAETSVPADLRKTLTAHPKAKATWEDITPIARRDWVLWIITAKQEETRKVRIARACSMLASGKRRVCCFPGPNWLRKIHARSGIRK